MSDPTRDLVAAMRGQVERGDTLRLRFGTVRSLSPLRVEVGASGVPVPVARDRDVVLAVGDAVYLFQQGAQFLLGGVYLPSE